MENRTATQNQWGHARINSFLTFGCTLFTVDFYLFKQSLSSMNPYKRKRWLSHKVTCPHFKGKKNYKEFLRLKKLYS